jgi:hypothetical protein
MELHNLKFCTNESFFSALFVGERKKVCCKVYPTKDSNLGAKTHTKKYTSPALGG